MSQATALLLEHVHNTVNESTVVAKLYTRAQSTLGIYCERILSTISVGV